VMAQRLVRTLCPHCKTKHDYDDAAWDALVAPWKAVAVLVLFFIIQQTENNFLVPKIMQKTIGVSPVFIILAILIGAKLLGILGAILAVPAMAGLAVVIEQWHTIFPLQKEVS